MVKRRHVIVPLLLALLLCCCGRRNAAEHFPSQTEKHPPVSGYVEGRELYALAETEEEAQKLAELYGIELVDFSDGVATFHTEENPHKVIERGIQNGWPRIEVNHTGVIYSE